MSDSSAAQAARESDRRDFPHGLPDLCKTQEKAPPIHAADTVAALPGLSYCSTMAATLERNEPLDEACRLVGRFLKHYAMALDLAIGKLLGLQGGTIDIIGANITVAKKVEVLFCAEKFLAAIPEKGRERFLEKTKGRILALNDDRVIVAHYPFDPGPRGGVSFGKVVTRDEL